MPGALSCAGVDVEYAGGSTSQAGLHLQDHSSSRAPANGNLFERFDQVAQQQRRQQQQQHSSQHNHQQHYQPQQHSELQLQQQHSWKDAAAQGLGGADNDGAGSDQLGGGGGAAAPAAADRIKTGKGDTADAGDLEQQAAVVADSRAASPVLFDGGRDAAAAAAKGSRAG